MASKFLMSSEELKQQISSRPYKSLIDDSSLANSHTHTALFEQMNAAAAEGNMVHMEKIAFDFSKYSGTITEICVLLAELSGCKELSEVCLLISSYVPSIQELILLSAKIHTSLSTSRYGRDIAIGFRNAWNLLITDAASLVVDIDLWRETGSTNTIMGKYKNETSQNNSQQSRDLNGSINWSANGKTNTDNSSACMVRRSNSLRRSFSSKRCRDNQAAKPLSGSFSKLDKVKTSSSANIMDSYNKKTMMGNGTSVIKDVRFGSSHTMKNEDIQNFLNAKNSRLNATSLDSLSAKTIEPSSFRHDNSRVSSFGYHNDSIYGRLQPRPKSSMALQKPFPEENLMTSPEEEHIRHINIAQSYIFAIVGFTKCSGPLKTTNDLFQLAEKTIQYVQLHILLRLNNTEYSDRTMWMCKEINEELGRSVVGQTETFAKVDNVVNLVKKLAFQLELITRYLDSLKKHRILNEFYRNNSSLLNFGHKKISSLSNLTNLNPSEPRFIRPNNYQSNQLRANINGSSESYKLPNSYAYNEQTRKTPQHDYTNSDNTLDTSPAFLRTNNSSLPQIPPGVGLSNSLITTPPTYGRKYEPNFGFNPTHQLPPPTPNNLHFQTAQSNTNQRQHLGLSNHTRQFAGGSVPIPMASNPLANGFLQSMRTAPHVGAYNAPGRPSLPLPVGSMRIGEPGNLLRNMPVNFEEVDLDMPGYKNSMR